jgi:hypothetical protein
VTASSRPLRRCRWARFELSRPKSVQSKLIYLCVLIWRSLNCMTFLFLFLFGNKSSYIKEQFEKDGKKDNKNKLIIFLSRFNGNGSLSLNSLNCNLMTIQIERHN